MSERYDPRKTTILVGGKYDGVEAKELIPPSWYNLPDQVYYRRTGKQDEQGRWIYKQRQRYPKIMVSKNKNWEPVDYDYQSWNSQEIMEEGKYKKRRLKNSADGT